jgi:phospholipid N-methyltransferase
MPTARYLVRRICDRLDLSAARVVVELGPGLGAFTRELLERLPAESTLVLIETNPDFASELAALGDSRLRVVHGSADHVKRVLRNAGLPGADLVLSGIPFSHFNAGRTSALLRDIRDVLGTDGRFVAYQCSKLLEAPLRRLFGTVRVERHFFHLPPLVVLEARTA